MLSLFAHLDSSSSFLAIALSMVSTSDMAPRSPKRSPKRDTRPALVMTAVLTPWKKGWLPDQMSTTYSAWVPPTVMTSSPLQKTCVYGIQGWRRVGQLQVVWMIWGE